MIRDRRGVSSALSYALVVMITLTLTAGLLLGTESLVDDQRHGVATDQLDVVGERLAATIMTVDRFTAVDGSLTMASVTREFPDRVAGSHYRVRTVQDTGSPDRATLYLEARDLDVNVSFSVRAQSASEIEETRVNGGTLRISYDPASDTVVIDSA